MTPLRLAVAGAGAIGRQHAARVAALGQARLVAFVDPSPAAAAAAAQHGVPLYGELAAMLRDERPDGVVLATPNALHVPGALQCLRAGVPALVEKPVAVTVAEALRLVRAQRLSGVPVLVGHHRRHSPCLQRARRIVDSGRLGRLVAVSGTALFHKPARYFSESPWRGQPGGGPILINLVHEIDSLRQLAGDIVEVQAFASSARRGLAVEDSAALVLRFASGALGSFIVSDTAAAPNSWEQTSGEDPAFAHYAGQDCYLLAGERGSLSVPTLRGYTCEGEASWHRALQPITVPATNDAADPLQHQIDHFCDIIRGQAAPLVDAEDAARTLAATLAVAESARSGRPVSCNLE